LVGVKEQYDSLTSGIADLGQLDLFADPQQFQLTGVVCDIPNVNFPSLKVRNQILLELLEKFPEMKRETKGVKILFIIPYPRNTLHFAKRLEVRKPEDLRGLRIATAPMLFPILDAWRTSPINIPWTDRYLALERGVIDGTFINWGPMSSMRLSEVTKAHTDKLGGLPQASGLVVVNEKVWNGLPPDIQKVFIENNEYGYTEFDRLGLMEEKRGREDCEKAGHLIIDTTPEEFALWSESYRALEDKWILEREAKGLPAKKILEEMKRLINVYSK
jgi:TRAP-type C4-dicarboxylate transport system substrate-binding protein